MCSLCCATARCALKHLTLWRERRATARGVNSLLITRPEHNLTLPLAISAHIISCFYQSAVFTFCRIIVECRRVLYSSLSHSLPVLVRLVLVLTRSLCGVKRNLSALVCVFGANTKYCLCDVVVETRRIRISSLM